MAQRQSLSKIVAVGLAAGASCFSHGDVLLKSQGASLSASGPGHHLAGGGMFQPRNAKTGYVLPAEKTASLYALSESGTSISSKDHVATSYYLLWSKGFLPKFGITTAALLGLHWAGMAGRIGMLLSRSWHTYFSGTFQNVLATCLPNVVLPLLSSSCCLLQLMINALVGAGGCAGFNTILGPVRPAFLSLLTYLNWTSRPSLATGIVRLSLALLPEIVYGWNQYLAYNWQSKVSKSMEGADTITATVEVQIPTMGCVACVNKIDTSLRQSAPAKILDASSWLDADKEKGGHARVRMMLGSQEELGAMKDMIVKSIDGAGFPGSSVVGQQVDEENEQLQKR